MFEAESIIVLREKHVCNVLIKEESIPSVNVKLVEMKARLEKLN